MCPFVLLPVSMATTASMRSRADCWITPLSTGQPPGNGSATPATLRPQHRAYLFHRELFLVVQSQHLLLPLRQFGDGLGQHLPPLALADRGTMGPGRAARQWSRPDRFPAHPPAIRSASCRPPVRGFRPAGAEIRSRLMPIALASSGSVAERPSSVCSCLQRTSPCRRALRRRSRGLQSSSRRLSRMAPRMRNLA